MAFRVRLIMVVSGVFFRRHRPDAWVRRCKPRMRQLLLLLAAVHYLFIVTMEHHGSVGWGMGRFFLPLYPILALGLPAFFHALGLARKSRPRASLLRAVLQRHIRGGGGKLRYPGRYGAERMDTQAASHGRLRRFSPKALLVGAGRWNSRRDGLSGIFPREATRGLWKWPPIAPERAAKK